MESETMILTLCDGQDYWHLKCNGVCGSMDKTYDKTDKYQLYKDFETILLTFHKNTLKGVEVK